MKITVNSNVLAKALTTVSRAVPQKTAVPILANFLFVGNGDSLSIIGSDGNLTIADTINTPAEGKIALPVSLLTFIKTLPDKEVTIDANGVTCNITYSNGHSSMPAFNAEEYPQIDINSDYEPVIVKGATLASALAHTTPCVQTDEMRPNLSGIYFHSKEDSLTLVGTDSRVLAKYPIRTDKQIGSFILPLATANILGSICGLGDVAISVGEKFCYFLFGTTLITSRIVVGKYPSYEAIFPQGNECKLTASKNSFLQTFRRIATCANKSADTIKITLDPLTTTITAEDLGFGVSAKENPESFRYDGLAFSIGFRAQYLIKAINAIDAPEVEVAMASPTKAAVIGALGEDDPCKILLMPVQIQ